MKSILSLLIVLFSITSLFAQNVCTVKILFSINKTNPPSYTFKTDPQTAGAKYSWTFGDNTISDSPTPTHIYSKSGSYVVHVQVKTGTDAAPKICYGELSAQFNGGAVTPVVPCKVNIVFTKTSTNPFTYSFRTDPVSTASSSKYLWTFGDGSANSDKPSPSHVFNKAGIYVVHVQVTTGTGTSATICYGEMSLKVEAATVTPPVVACNVKIVSTKNSTTPASYTFKTDPLKTGGKYSWTFGDNTLSDSPTPTHSFSKTDTYLVLVKVTGVDGNICTGELKTAFDGGTVTPVVPCKVSILSSKSSTNPLSYSFKTDPASTSSKFVWSFGDGSNNSDTPLPTHTFSKAGTYVIHVYVTTGTGPDAKICYGEMSVQVNTTAILPNCKGPINLLLFDPTNNLCNGSATVKLLDEAGKEIPNVKYLWSDGRTGSSAGTLCPGKLYTVQATIENVCQKTTSFTLLSKPLWQSSSVDGVNNFTVLAPVDGVQYEWNFGNGVTKIGPSVSYNFQKDGIYDVQLKAVSLDGVSESTKQVVVMKSVATSDVINKSEVDLYPNPAKEIIRVDFKNPAEGTLKVEIKNLSGRSVYIEQITNDGSSHADINIQNLNAGMYVLRITNDQRIIGEKKFIKTN